MEKKQSAPRKRSKRQREKKPLYSHAAWRGSFWRGVCVRDKSAHLQQQAVHDQHQQLQPGKIGGRFLLRRCLHTFSLQLIPIYFSSAGPLCCGKAHHVDCARDLHQLETDCVEQNHRPIEPDENQARLCRRRHSTSQFFNRNLVQI